MAFARKRQKLKQTYMNLSIRYKILVLNFIVIILIAVIIGLFSYLIYSRSIIKKISTVNLRDTRQVRNSIDHLQKEIYELSTYICLSAQIQQILSLDSISAITLNEINKAMEPVSGLLAFNEAISFISIYGENGLEYYTSKDGSTGISTKDLIEESSIYQEMAKLKGGPLWKTISKKDRLFIKDNRNSKIAMFRSLLEMNNLQTKGMLMICINLAFIEDLCRESLDYEKSAIFIIDDQYQIIMGISSTADGLNRPELVESLVPYLVDDEGQRIIDINRNKVLLTYSTLEKNNWKTLYMVPTRIVLQPVQTILWITMVVVFICLLIGFALSMYTSSLVTKPINKLLFSMNRVKQGNFKEKVHFIYQDEIGRLGAQYNEMIDHIHHLINRVLKLQLKEKEAELRALQAQINPHFLYNTLDTIFWKAQKVGQYEISDMIYALSNIFRLTLNQGEDFISIYNEKQLIENYILLQKKRFNDKLTYQIEFEERILNYSIPKLIIQPFVENAVIHGAEKSDNNTVITVTGNYEEGKIHFSITDNGAGIESSKLVALQQDTFMEKKETNGGYAIHNVKGRLDLYYHGNYDLTIDSREGKGTKVEIVIPAKQGGRKNV